MCGEVLEPLLFSNRWLKGWCWEYVSSKRPNKQHFLLSQEKLKRRIISFVKNIWTNRYFLSRSMVSVLSYWVLIIIPAQKWFFFWKNIKLYHSWSNRICEGKLHAVLRESCCYKYFLAAKDICVKLSRGHIICSSFYIAWGLYQHNLLLYFHSQKWFYTWWQLCKYWPNHWRRSLQQRLSFVYHL